MKRTGKLRDGIYTAYSLLEKLIEVAFKDLFKLILACS